MTSPPSDSAEDLRQDSRDLRRGVRTNLAGHVSRIAQPLLLMWVTHTFGGRWWGLYVLGYAAVFLLARASMLGFPKGLAYWIPRAISHGQSSGFLGACRRSLFVASAVGLIMFVASPWIAELQEAPDAGVLWRWMAIGLPGLALLELAIHASVARRRIDLQVWVRDVAVPVGTVGLAPIGYHFIGPPALPIAFVVATWGGALYATYRVWKWIEAQDENPWELPHELTDFSKHAWGADMISEGLYRLDIVVLGVFAPPVVVGVYGIATQFGNTVRALRGTLGPLLTSLFSGIASTESSARLRRAFDHATCMAVVVQLPVVMVMCLFGRELLALFGSSFAEGYTAMLILCIGWHLHSWFGLAEQVVTGLGRADLNMRISALALVLLVVSLVVLCPRFGAEGAALAVVASFGVHAITHFMIGTDLLGGLLWGPASGRLAWVSAFAIGSALLLKTGATHFDVPFGSWIAMASFFVFFGPTAWSHLGPNKAAANTASSLETP